MPVLNGWMKSQVPRISFLPVHSLTRGQELFTVMCRITANLDELCDTLQPRLTFDEYGNERRYYRINFQIALLFGMTEFQALVIWKDGDVSD